MNTYQKEHFDTFRLVMDYLAARPATERRYLLDLLEPYVDFRRRLDAFQQAHVAEFCTTQCYQTGLSACCSRDSIVVYFADVVVNCLHSSMSEIGKSIAVLERPNPGHRCIYLTPQGCRWRINPIVCGMFLCDGAEACILGDCAQTEKKWRAFENERLRYTWPDRPVVFDALEHRFIERGLFSELMHLNSSPGLLALKRKAGLLKQRRPIRKGKII